MKTSIRSLSCILVLLFAAITVHAATNDFGQRVGLTVSYKNIMEDTDAGSYGSPAISGDSLVFDPLGLSAVSASADSGFDVNDAQLQFDVQAKPGRHITELQFSELGDYLILGASASTYAQVTATFFVNVLEVDGSALSPATSDAFGPVTQTFTTGPSGTWDQDFDIDISQILVDNSIPFTRGATLVSVNLDNILIASSEIGTHAQIQKKDAAGFAVTAIPEPTSMVLLMGTTGLLVFVRRTFSI